MYKHVLLAYDGSLEGRTALREGALLAKACHAQVFFLSVLPDTSSFNLSEGFASAQRTTRESTVFDEGVARLKQMNLNPVARMMTGDPGACIGAFAKEVDADLVVVGHKRQSALSRWWSGSQGGYLCDHVNCSILIGRCVIDDETFANDLRKLERSDACVG
jgi:nucleotide-binding universal stress UspA family protein